MVKFNIDAFRYLTQQHFRLLTAVEMGMKNHELVPLALVSSIAGIHRGATARILNDLTRSRLAAYERGKKFDGYRLTTLGYDFLALRALCSKGAIASIGNQIGVGKESDIYVGGDSNSQDLVLKFHRLGRTSFRKIKEKRDYHRRRHFCSWLYLSRLAAAREFAFLSALHSHQFPVPKPIEICRHTVVMELIAGPTLCNVSQLKSPAILYDKLMEIIIKLASYGLIHADFNEFNIMLMEDENPIIIDFPQMVSIEHPNAQFYFDRDVQCIRTFFQRRFHFDGEEWPEFKDIQRKHNLDTELDASGFKKLTNKTLNKAYDEGDFEAHLEENCCEDEETDEDEHLNEEEEKIEEDDDDMEFKLAGSSEQFQNWLEQAQNELAGLTVEEGKISLEQLEGMIGEEREAKAKEIMGRIGKGTAKTMVREKLWMEAQNDEDEREKRGKEEIKPVGVAHSIMSTSTIIPKEEIQRRLLMERGKAKKEKLRIKGQQCAVRRSRKENRQMIKEYEGWDEY